MLAFDSEQLPTRREDVHAGGVADDSLNERSERLQHVLAAIDHDERAAVD
jgi:hypothetical protein